MFDSATTPTTTQAGHFNFASILGIPEENQKKNLEKLRNKLKQRREEQISEQQSYSQLLKFFITDHNPSERVDRIYELIDQIEFEEIEHFELQENSFVRPIAEPYCMRQDIERYDDRDHVDRLTHSFLSVYEDR